MKLQNCTMTVVSIFLIIIQIIIRRYHSLNIVGKKLIDAEILVGQQKLDEGFGITQTIEIQELSHIQQIFHFINKPLFHFTNNTAPLLFEIQRDLLEKICNKDESQAHGLQWQHLQRYAYVLSLVMKQNMYKEYNESFSTLVWSRLQKKMWHWNYIQRCGNIYSKLVIYCGVWTSVTVCTVFPLMRDISQPHEIIYESIYNGNSTTKKTNVGMDET